MQDGSNPSASALDALGSALVHRGPDGGGRCVRDGVGLVHRRLSIIDLATGTQPMVSPSGVSLVTNGEIYNFIELRQGILKSSTFKTNSDSEVILHLYHCLGYGFVKMLRGMYAIALHDPATGRLILARDPYGIKPLYYVETPTCFAFASESQALQAAGLAGRELISQRVGELLQLNFTTAEETVFQGVKRVLPGELIVVEGGRIVERHRWHPLPEGPPIVIGESEALAQMDKVFRDSVEIHQRSDVPYGLFLSGGIDSRSVLACMSRYGAERVRAYTAAFPEGRDEYETAAKAARLFEAQIIRVEITTKHFWNDMPSAVATMDDPVSDAAFLGTYIVAREAAKDVKVVLGGEGADELFAGYSRYRRQALPKWLFGRERRRKGPFSEAGILRDAHADWRDGLAKAQLAATNGHRSRLQVAQALDCADFLSHHHLTKIDRPMMAHGLEGRTPFLDLSVGAFGYQLPQNLKLRRGRGKYLLRLWLSKQAPQDDCFARKKGFTPPYLRWVYQQGKILGPLVAADPVVDQFCRPGLVPKLFLSENSTHQEMAWRLLFLALWHRRHVRSLSMDGNIAECLAQSG